jgi:glucose-1-phosphate thymidylyltransferase
MKMKGIILAGGHGTRLYPCTKVVSKQMLPVYDKPLIYYPLSVLLLAGIKDILIITTPQDQQMYVDLLGDGTKIGIQISYQMQKKPNGLAEAFLLGEKFIGKDSVCLVLGDNVFYGHYFSDILLKAKNQICNYGGACIFGYPVKNPKAFGVVEFDEKGKALSIEEKPENPKSNYAVPGLYFYDNSVVEVAKNVQPSARGELEITSINNAYLEKGTLHVTMMGRGMAWLDTGTPSGMLKAANFVESVQAMQGFYISCIEEIAWRKGFITREQLRQIGEELCMTDYGKYLVELSEGEE